MKALSMVGWAACLAVIGAARPAENDDPATALKLQFAEDSRLDNVGFSMLHAAVPFCGEAATRRTGFRFTNLPAFTRPMQAAARSLGFGDTATVVSVARGGPAERAGLRPNDRLVAIDGQPIPAGVRAVPALRSRFVRAARESGASVRATVRRDGAEIALVIPLDSTCGFNLVSWRESTIDAWGDGEVIAVTTPMLRYAATDSVLAVIVAHEIAHNAIRRTTKRSVSFDAAWSAVTDMVGQAAVAARGEKWASMRLARPTEAFAADVEKRADDLTGYLLARSGRTARSSRDFWWSLLVEKPGTVAYSEVHPTTAERLFRLDQIVAEIDAKKGTGLDSPGR